MLLRKILICSILLLSYFYSNAEKIKGKISVDGKSPISVIVSVDGKDYTIAEKEGEFELDVDIANDAFYNVYGRIGDSQVNLVVFLQNDVVCNMDIELNDNMLSYIFPKKDIVNNVLQQYRTFSIQMAMKIWKEDISSGQIENLLSEYDDCVKKLITQYKLDKRTKEYLKMSALVDKYKSLNSIEFRLSQDKSFEIPDKLESGVIANAGILDNADALTIYAYDQVIVAYLKQKESLSDKLELLAKKFSNSSVVDNVLDLVMDNFLKNHNFNSDFEGGLREMQVACEKIGDKANKYLDTYKARKYVINGAVMPDIMLEKTDGTKVSLKSVSSEGKIIFIDCWASWCGPCCKEIPYLQALEKEMSGSDVLFISISCDKNRSAWKNKMLSLNIDNTEHQYIDVDGKFMNLMNISGIPHFIIYDKNGKLKYYKAPRPSQASELKRIFSELK